MRMIKIVFAGTVAFGMTVSADTVDADRRVQWLPAVTEGYYNDSASWTDGKVPPHGADSLYGYVNFQNNDVTIKVPDGGLVENSCAIFLGAGSTTHTLTIDTRGTFWEKRGIVAVNDWWGVPFAANLISSHAFNFEGMNQSANDARVWRFDDALFTWKSNNSRQDFDLWSGTMAMSKNAFLGAGGGTVNFYVHPGSTIETDYNITFSQRGNATTHTWFLGGSHSIYNLHLKEANANPGKTWMHVTNDANVAIRNELHLGARNYGNVHTGGGHGILDVSSGARLSVTGTVYLGSGPEYYQHLINRGDLALRDNASFYAHAHSYIGRSQCSTGVVEVADNATFVTGGTCYLGYSSNSWGRLSFKGHSSSTIGGILWIADNVQQGSAYGEVVVDDDATLSLSPVVGNWMCLGSHSQTGSVARFTAKGRSRVTASSASWVEMGYDYDADLEFRVEEDAVVTFPGGGITNKVPVGGRSVVGISSNGVLAVRCIRGGVPGTGEDCMQFVADGGTLTVSGTSTPPVPFICGCASATIGANGLTFDSASFDVTFNQAFTAVSGAANATFTKTGTGTLVVKKDSSHPRTHVATGALVFAGGAKRFGNILEVADGARLALADTSSRIEADSIVFGDALAISVPADLVLDAAHPILVVDDGLTAAQVEKILVANPQTGRAYTFALGADNKTVSVTVSAAAGSAKTWAGASGADWNTAANWDPAGVPTHNDAVTVASAAAIAVSAPASVATINATAAAAVSVTGDDALLVASGVSVAQGGTLTLDVPLRNADGTVAKTGAGNLVVSGNNAATMQGNWELESGVTEFTMASSIGADSSTQAALAVSNSTFRYSGAATTIERPWRLLGEYPSIFDIAGDLTFRNFKISHLQGDGGFAKLGTGTLTLDVPTGTTTLSWFSNADRKGNADINDILALQNGGATSWNGLAQMTVLEGRLAVIGQGKTASIVKQEHHGGIGGSGVVAASAPELYLKDVDFTSGSGSGFHMIMGSQMASGSVAPRLVLDNANMTCNGLNVGHNKVSGNADLVHPVLAITNGTLDITWNASIPNNVGGIEPIVRVGANGVLRRVAHSAAGGINFNQKIDARFEDGGLLEVGSPQNVYFGDNSSGSLVFARGGGMKTHRFLAYSTTAELVLDGGFAEFTLNGGVSTTISPVTCCIRAGAGGGELIVGSGVEHALAVPLRGGRFVKKGAGTLVLTNDLSFTLSSNLPVYTPLASTTVKVANTGGVEIAEGVLKCVAGATDASSRFSGVGTLSGEFDTFTLVVEPGATDALTFSDLTATRVTVDFGHDAENPIDWRTTSTAAVAHIPSEAAFRAISWVGVNCGDGITSEFRYDSATGLVTAQFRPTGFLLIFK